MKQKRLLTTALALAALLYTGVNKSFAGPVDLKTARQVAAYYMGVQTGQKSMTADDVNLVYTIDNTLQEIPALYFFNTNNGGFIIISGSDCMEPVIAYSTEGTIDASRPLPPAMQWFLNDYTRFIVDAQNSKATPSAPIRATWDEVLNETIAEPKDGEKTVYKTLTSIWDQDAPYNNMCPTINGQHCPTGCVATMMAQVLHYWKYPYVGKGQVTYDWNGQQLSANFSEAYYNYDIMVDTVPYNNYGTCTLNQSSQDAIALLNYHCGIAVRMGYGNDGSGAYTRQYLARAMRTYFKYPSAGLNYIERDQDFANYSGVPNAMDTLWRDTVASDIRKGRPVCYDGTDISSTGVHAGHAFVAERYNSSNGRIWFNWGWSGYGNAWFNVITSQMGAMGYTFSTSHGALIGLEPPADTLAARGVGIRDVEQPAVELSAVYPNPASQQVTVPFNLHETGSALLQVYTIDGRLVESRTVVAGQSQAQIDVRNYAKGLYVVRLNGVARKFMVQ